MFFNISFDFKPIKFCMLSFNFFIGPTLFQPVLSFSSHLKQNLCEEEKIPGRERVFNNLEFSQAG